MPDVRIANPEVKISLNGGETTTVPTGERWIVDVSTIGTGATKIRDSGGLKFLQFSDESQKRIRLSGGDTIEAQSGTVTVLRGDVVST